MAAGLVDFHNHFVGSLPSEAAARWPLLAHEQSLMVYCGLGLSVHVFFSR